VRFGGGRGFAKMDYSSIAEVSVGRKACVSEERVGDNAEGTVGQRALIQDERNIQPQRVGKREAQLEEKGYTV